VESTSDPFARELMLGIFGTIARFESERRSARIKAGIERKREEEAAKPASERKSVGGRKPGAKDAKPRRRSSYVAAWEPGGARRVKHEESRRSSLSSEGGASRG
jgi:DNA invertase Pin-like site-specific DNA recombinase